MPSKNVRAVYDKAYAEAYPAYEAAVYWFAGGYAYAKSEASKAAAEAGAEERDNDAD